MNVTITIKMTEREVLATLREFSAEIQTWESRDDFDHIALRELRNAMTTVASWIDQYEEASERREGAQR